MKVSGGPGGAAVRRPLERLVMREENLDMRDCEKCRRLAPQQWEMLECGSTREEWQKKIDDWWEGRPEHMGCTDCRFASA